jgi:hypothetical protein
MIKVGQFHFLSLHNKNIVIKRFSNYSLFVLVFFRAYVLVLYIFC